MNYQTKPLISVSFIVLFIRLLIDMAWSRLFFSNFGAQNCYYGFECLNCRITN